jgi:hypothetical protein
LNWAKKIRIAYATLIREVPIPIMIRMQKLMQGFAYPTVGEYRAINSIK